MRKFWLLMIIGLTIFLPLAQAATDGVDVNLTVDAPASTDGGGGTPDPDPVLGCTDSAASNYNSSATQDNGSCTYPVVVTNASNFTVTYNTGTQVINLTWQNPSFSGFAGVRIMRSTSFFPTSPTSGSLIYDGTGQSAVDSSVVAGTTYYYTIFAYSDSGTYASGAVASENVPIPEAEEEEPVPEPEPDPVDDPSVDGGDGGPTIPDPFESFPAAISLDPLIQALNLGDFVFFQPGERRQFFAGGEAIGVNASKPLTITIDATRLPEALKAIGLTIGDPVSKKPLTSFLLRSTDDKSQYLASLAPFLKPGRYPISIHILNFRDQSIKRLVGSLVVGGVGSVFSRGIKIAGRVVTPLAIGVGLASGVIEGLALSAKVASFTDLYLLILNFINIILKAFGLKKRERPWGVVYDSVTKRPIDPAYVVVRKGQADVNTAITDLDGRYSFFLPAAGVYNLVANKTHYAFPSAKLTGKNSDELYDSLYFGGDFNINEGEVVNKNIPLDPVGFDWNEFAKNQRGFFYLQQKRERLRKTVVTLLYVGGFALTLYQVLFHPRLLNIVVLVLYFAAFGLKYLWRYHRPVVGVKHAGTNLPVPFALIHAYIPNIDQQIKSVAADALGRFFLLTPPGDYYLTVEEKLPDGTYQKIHQTPTMHLTRGLVTQDLVV